MAPSIFGIVLREVTAVRAMPTEAPNSVGPMFGSGGSGGVRHWLAGYSGAALGYVCRRLIGY